MHAEGEIGRVAIGGVPKIPGETVADQLAWLNSDPKGQELRRMLGWNRAARPSAPSTFCCRRSIRMPMLAFVILQPDQAHASSGSNSICATTALLETGMVEMQEPENDRDARDGSGPCEGDGRPAATAGANG